MKKKKLSVWLSETLKEALKKECLKKGISMTDYIEGLISKSLKRN